MVTKEVMLIVYRHSEKNDDNNIDNIKLPMVIVLCLINKLYLIKKLLKAFAIFTHSTAALSLNLLT